MQILIYGRHTANHKKIASDLAKRLHLPLLTDNYCLEAVQKLCDETGDFICDSVYVKDIKHRGITIFIDRCLSDVTEDILTVYNKTTETVNTCSDSVFSYDNYQLVINYTYHTEDFVVNWIINSIVDGSAFSKGIYLPAELVIPSEFQEIPTEFNEYDYKYMEFNIQKFKSTYIVYDNLQYVIQKWKKGDLLKVHGSLSELSSFALGNSSDYYWWSDYVPDYDGVRRLNTMLAKYCYNIDAPDYDLVLTQLSENGNALKKLNELGY